jgi:hypothetical protein
VLRSRRSSAPPVCPSEGTPFVALLGSCDEVFSRGGAELRYHEAPAGGGPSGGSPGHVLVPRSRSRSRSRFRASRHLRRADPERTSVFEWWNMAGHYSHLILAAPCSIRRAPSVARATETSGTYITTEPLGSTSRPRSWSLSSSTLGNLARGSAFGSMPIEHLLGPARARKTSGNKSGLWHLGLP